MLKRCLLKEQQQISPEDLILSKPVASRSHGKEVRQLMFRQLVELDSQACRATGKWWWG